MKRESWHWNSNLKSEGLRFGNLRVSWQRGSIPTWIVVASLIIHAHSHCRSFQGSAIAGLFNALAISHQSAEARL